MSNDIKIPTHIIECLGADKPLGSQEISAFKKWALSLPKVEFSDHEERHEKKCCCHCCCCCCCDKKEEGSGNEEQTALFVWNPSLMLHVNPSGIRRNIERIEGTFSWSAPPGTTSIAIEWERYAPNGSIMSAFAPIGPNYMNLAPSGFAVWDTGWGSWGHRVHIRATTDTGISSRVRWRDGNGGAGWL